MDSRKKQKNSYRVFYDDYMNTNASTECTGLIPRYVGGEDAWDEYHEIFDFTPRATESIPDGTDD